MSQIIETTLIIGLDDICRDKKRTILLSCPKFGQTGWRIATDGSLEEVFFDAKGEPSRFLTRTEFKIAMKERSRKWWGKFGAQEKQDRRNEKCGHDFLRHPHEFA